MVNVIDNNTSNLGLSKPFWVVWAIELWERFGYYGTQAILALFFVNYLGYSETKSFYVFGSFSAFVYGFVWVGGWLGDNYFGAKRTLMLGAIILMISYAGLALSGKGTVFYALGGIIVGNALFKANPTSLISKMFEKGNPAIDSAMTMYYMAVNIGSMASTAATPFIAQYLGWKVAFWVCAFGLFVGLGNYIVYRRILASLSTPAGEKPFSGLRLVIIIIGSLLAIPILAKLLYFTWLSDVIIYTVVTLAFLYFLRIAFSLDRRRRNRMLVAFALILEAVVFFALYNQMPTSLIFFGVHNVNNHIFGFTIPGAEYYVLNPIVIVIMSPILAKLYTRFYATHVTKFCIGMTLSALAFSSLALPQLVGNTPYASPLWMVLIYVLQSTGELLISGLGIAMVAELCPTRMSGFVMGIWWLSSMLAGPIGAALAALTAPPKGAILTPIQSMAIYSHAFLEIGVMTGAVAILMWIIRPYFNRILMHDPIR